MVDTSGSGAYAYLSDDQNVQLNNVSGTLSATLWGIHKGALLSDWVPVPSNATAPPTKGRVRVVFHGDANSATYKGVALASYEYRRFEPIANAKPTWLPIRFPGQYYDAETDLFQNWNRFYDPSTGRYLEPEPLWLYPEKLLVVARRARETPVYAYAANSPITTKDPEGLTFSIVANNDEDASAAIALIDYAAKNDSNPELQNDVRYAIMSGTTNLTLDVTGNSAVLATGNAGQTNMANGDPDNVTIALSVAAVRGEQELSTVNGLGQETRGANGAVIFAHEGGHWDSLLRTGGLDMQDFNDRSIRYENIERTRQGVPNVFGPHDRPLESLR